MAKKQKRKPGSEHQDKFKNAPKGPKDLNKKKKKSK
jgi:hypothetical protein